MDVEPKQELELVVNWVTRETKPISEINTRHLLRIYRSYMNRFYYRNNDENDRMVAGLIKAELSTREHIQNRTESKWIRRRNAKKFRSVRSKNK